MAQIQPSSPCGIICNFVTEREKEFERPFDVVDFAPIDAPTTLAVHRYAVVKGNPTIANNVLIAQRAFLENATMGDVLMLKKIHTSLILI